MRKMLALLVASLLLASAGWGMAGAKGTQVQKLRKRVATLEAQMEALSAANVIDSVPRDEWIHGRIDRLCSALFQEFPDSDPITTACFKP